MIKSLATLFLLTLFVGLAACGGDEAQLIAAEPTQTAMPTPTLVPGLPTVPLPSLTPSPRDTAVTTTATVPLPTDTLVPTLTPLPTPTNTPLPVERVELAAAGLHNGNYAQAITQLEASVQEPALFTRDQQINNWYSLGVAYLRDGRYGAALATFDQLIAEMGEDTPTATYFHLAQAHQYLSNHTSAIEAYQTYLNANTDLGAYIYPLLAEAYTAVGDTANAQMARELAVEAPAHRLTEIKNRRILADRYMANENYPAAITQYDAIRNQAVTQFTQGEMNYLAGYTDLLAGNTNAAYDRFQQGLTAYPQAYETYLGLVALVDAGVPVDDYHRALVNYYADSFEPATAAFERYIQANPDTYDPEVHLYAAWSYEGLGNLPAALAQLDSLANSDPAAATIERGKMLARAGDIQGALENYQFYLQNYPDHQSAPFAAWWSAVIAERQGDILTAVARYTALADNYAQAEDAPEALFRAGWLAYRSGDVSTAVLLWDRAAQNYPATEFGEAALVWQLRTLPDYRPAATEETEVRVPDPHKMLAFAQQQAISRTAVHYYGLRAKDIATDQPPFTAVVPFALPDAEQQSAEQEAAEAWLRDWLGLEPETDIRTLSAQLATDPRLIRGEKLWQIGLYEAAKQELEAVRATYNNDALSSYQLALYFRDLGLYRSSILAAVRLPVLAGQSVLTLPKFIGRLVYPVYYADLVLPLAAQYGYDARLQFALLRQESLFESFATSSAVAQGLSQVIPDTGAYIAQQLNWPNYKNEDLYKPDVGLNFGGYYLDQQLDTFNGDAHAALAAYNAGPGNAARWYDAAGSDLDLFVEVVDFAETRLYIERIFEGYVMYRYLYGE